MQMKKPVIHDLDQLHGDYARYRQWLCEKEATLAERLQRGAMVQPRSFLELAAGFTVILLDAHGVLTMGDEVIPGAAAAVHGLRAMGKVVRVVTNNASQSPEKLLHRFREKGFPFEQTEVVTSGMTVREAMARSPWCEAPYLLVGTEESRESYAPPWRAGEARYVLMCSNRDYYRDSRLMAAVESLLERGPVPVVLANPDLVAPEGQGRMNPVAGYTVARWAERFPIAVIGLGKPFAAVFQRAMAGLEGVAPRQVLMVGDTLDTDILGGLAMGYRTCLTASGAYHGLAWAAIRALCHKKMIFPDYLVAGIGDWGVAA